MTIKISQTASNIKQSFDIEGEGFDAQGEVGRFIKYQKISLKNRNTNLTGVFKFSNFVNYIPFRYIFKKPNQIKRFSIFKDGESFGNIVSSVEGFFKSRNIITLSNGNTLYCYSLSSGRFNYISIYKNDTQIALIETFLTTTDYKYNHKLYILDEYTDLAQTLTLYTLYYANFYFCKRFHMSFGSSYSLSYTLSAYNEKFDPPWRENHFPNENFFGKINILNDK